MELSCGQRGGSDGNDRFVSRRNDSPDDSRQNRHEFQVDKKSPQRAKNGDKNLNWWLIGSD
jgi:hypothetical protein